MKYVYTHSINGVVFYVGCGIKSRPYSKHNRNKKWTSLVKANNGIFNVNICSTHKNKDEALTEESRLIRLIYPDCNIKTTKYKRPIPTPGIKHINTQLPDKLKDDLEKHSKESGMLMQKITELALIAYIKKHKK